MKKLFLISFLFSFLSFGQESIQDACNYGRDKQLHENVGYVFGVTGVSLMLNSNKDYSYIESIAATTVISATPILGKEFYDQSFKPNGFASEQDMVWGFYGVIEGASTTALTYWGSDKMLDMKIHGINDPYTVMWLFVGTGVPFFSELGKWGFVDGYRMEPLNIVIKSAVNGVSLLIKRHYDKKKKVNLVRLN